MREPRPAETANDALLAMRKKLLARDAHPRKQEIERAREMLANR